MFIDPVNLIPFTNAFSCKSSDFVLKIAFSHIMLLVRSEDDFSPEEYKQKMVGFRSVFSSDLFGSVCVLLGIVES